MSRRQESGCLRVSGLLRADTVSFYQSVRTRSSALSKLVELLEFPSDVTDRSTCLKLLYEHEAIDRSSGIGGGVALPYVSCVGIAKPCISAICVKHGVDWDAPDGQPVDLIFLVAVPPERQSELLLLTARLISLLSDGALVQKLRASENEREFLTQLACAEAMRFA